MARFAVTRVSGIVVTLLGSTVIVFAMLHLTGDPTALLLSDSATPHEIAVFRHVMGFDRPLYLQYLDFLTRLIHGDFGDSLRYQQPAMTVVLSRVPATAELMGLAILLSVIVSVPLAFFAAITNNVVSKGLFRLVTLFGQGIPGFVLAILLILIFSVQLRILPAAGNDSPQSAIMPSIVLALYSIPQLTRVLRTSLVSVLQSDYIRTARAKGVRRRAIYGKHALRNAVLPFLTLIGVQVGALLGGSVVTETVFGWPGMGQLMVQAISNRDYPVVQSGVFFVVTVFLAVNLAVDISYGFIDPRIKTR